MTRRDDGTLIVHARGDLDMITAHRLRETVAHAVDRAAGHGVAVDLSAVTFIDSVGLAALVTVFKTTRAAGLPFTVAAASPSAARLLRMTGLARLWALSTDGPPTAPNDPLSGLAPAG